MRRIISALAIATLVFSCDSGTEQKIENKIENQEQITMKNNIYNHTYLTPTGESKSFEDLKGDLILIVNTATQCGLTPQFEGLEKLHNNYSEKGLKVLGFPCNQFGGQEPLTNEEMVETCKVNHGVTFELAQKIEVNGGSENPLYSFLKSEQKIEGENDIRWNFEKFLVNKEGEVVKRFSPQTTPEELTAEIEGML
ncbi:MAG: glutathione peroxidase [Flavobacteriales bacterium]